MTTRTTSSATTGTTPEPAPTGVRGRPQDSCVDDPQGLWVAGQGIDLRSMQPPRTLAFGFDAYTVLAARLSAIVAGEGLEPGEGPTREAGEGAYGVLAAFREVHAVPERVIPDGEGGLSFYMFSLPDPARRTHVRFGSIGIGADGSLILLRGDRSLDQREVTDIAPGALALRHAVESLVRFVGGGVGSPP